MFQRASIQVKVSLFLVLLLAVVFGLSTTFSTRFVTNLLGKAAHREAGSVFQSLELGTRGSLERGEMDMFETLIQDLGKIQGVEEVGLAGPAGSVSYSSRKEAVGKPLDPEAFQRALRAAGKPEKLDQGSSLALMRAHIYEANCMGCHEKATQGSVAGVLYVRYSLSALKSAKAQGILMGISAGLVGLAAASVGVYLLLGFLVRRPLAALNQRLKDMASGEADLTLRLPVTSSDEMGDVAKHFNTFVENLQTLIRQVLGTVREVSEGNESITQASQSMLQGATEQSDRTQAAASSAEEMSATVLQVARSTQEAADVARLASQTAESGATVVEQGAGGMDRVAERVKAIAQTVQELGEQSRNIADVMQVIDDIADQTNLLALNAAIEAARAGEHGRGFAVVADEVRKLSEKTANATQQVRDMVVAIRSETAKAVSSVEAGLTEAEESVTLSRRAGDSLREIVSQIAKNSDMVNQIATATEQQSAAVSEISQNLESVAGLARDTATGVEQTSATARTLEDRTRHLLDLVGRFRV